jgi:hypothetical protein
MKRVYITHITPNYIDLAINLTRSIRNFSDIPVLIYCINPDSIENMRRTYSHIDGLDFRKISLNIEENDYYLDNSADLDKYGENRKSARFIKIISAKVIAMEMALEEGFDEVCYLDSDCLATPLVDELFEWSNLIEGYPIGAEGIHEYMVYLENGNQKGNPFEFSWPEPDNKLSLEWPIMNFIGAKPESRPRYNTTNVMLANSECLDFIKVWKELCYIIPRFCDVGHVAPFHEETVYNALKSKSGNNMIPLCYVNLLNGFKTVEDFYSDAVKGGESNYDNSNNLMWFYKIPSDKRRIKVFHGEKNTEESNRIINYLSEKFREKKNNSKSAIAIFSHANTKERLECLKQSIISVKKLGLPIIVSSGIPIGKECEDLCDHVKYVEKNVVFKDSDLIDHFCKIDEPKLIVWECYISNILVKNRLPKITYGSACVNHYISVKNLALEEDIDRIIIWEYDGLLGDKSSEFLKDTIKKLDSSDLDYFYFFCLISGIPSCYATPAIYSTRILNSNLPKAIIESPKDFLDLTDFSLVTEEFALSKIIGDNKNGIYKDLSEYPVFMPDSNKDLFTPESNLITSILSGLFIGEDNDSEILYIFKFLEIGKSSEKISIDIYIDEDKKISREGEYYPGMWFYFGTGCTYSDIASGKKLKSVEKLGSEDFVLELNEKNIESYKKLRKFSIG